MEAGASLPRAPHVPRAPQLLIGIPLGLPLALIALVIAIALLFGANPNCGGVPGSLSIAVPAELVPIYQQAAIKYRLGPQGPSILAAINKLETGFGANTSSSSAGAQGPMQFLPSTWATYGVDANHDGARDIANPSDAIFAAASYLRASGAPGDWYAAILAYNHAEWYVQEVLVYARKFQGNAATTMDSASVGCAAPSGTYINPFQRGSWGLARTDQGVDFIPLKPEPVLAIGDAKIVEADANGWGRFGAFLSYKLLDGSQAGHCVFVAEHLTHMLPVGTPVSAGQPIATALPGPYWTEWGWAQAPNTPSTPYNGRPDGTPMPGGKAFARFLKSLGAKVQQDPGPGPTYAGASC